MNRQKLIFFCLFFFSGSSYGSECVSVLADEWQPIDSQISDVLDSPVLQQAVLEWQVRLKWPLGYGQKAADVSELGIRESDSESSFRRLFSRYDSWLRKEVDHHNSINPSSVVDLENETLRPGMLFVKESDPRRKEWVTLRPGEPVPEGFKPFALDGSTFPPGEALYPALAKGLFPLAIHFSSSSAFLESPHRYIDPIAHDLLGHLTSYPRHIIYAKAYRSIASRIMQIHEENVSKGSQRPWSFLYKTGLFSRVYTVNEGLIGVRKERLPGIIHLLGLSRQEFEQGYLPTFRELYPKEVLGDEIALQKLYIALSKEIPKTILPYGGASLIASPRGSEAQPHHNFVHYWQEVGFEASAAVSANLDSESKMKGVHTLAIAIGMIRGYLIYMKDLDLSSLPDQIFSTRPDPHWPLTQFLSRDSGFLEAYSEFIKLISPTSEVSKILEMHPILRFSSEYWDSPVPDSRAN